MATIRHHIGIKLLRKRFKKIKRDKSIQNFETAREAAIVFDIQLQDSFNVIKEFAKFLESNKVNTTVIGYSTAKEPPEKLLLWPNFNVITKKNIKWYGKPKGEIAEAFFKKKYDLLFIITHVSHLPVLYFQMLSRAKFKIGYYTDEENDLDLMINPIDNPHSTAYFIEQVKTYINMLNHSN